MPNLETKNTTERNELDESLNSFKLSLKELKQKVKNSTDESFREKTPYEKKKEELSKECRKKRSDIFNFITKNGKKEKITDNDVEFQYKMEFNAEGKHIVMRNKYYKNRGTEIEMITKANGKQEFLRLKQDKVHADYDTFIGGGTGFKTTESKVTRGGKGEKIILDEFMDKIQKYGK